MKTETFYAIWLRVRGGSSYWVGLDDERAPFLYDTPEDAEANAQVLADKHCLPHIVAVTVPVPNLEPLPMLPKKPPKPKPLKPRGYAQLRPPKRTTTP